MRLMLLPPGFFQSFLARFCVTCARLVWGMGALGLAERLLTHALVLAPKSAQTHATWAHLLARSGCYAAALPHQLASCDFAPSSAAGWFNLGFLHERLQHWPQAEDAFRKAIALSPSLDLAWFGLGRVLQFQGRLEEALHALAQSTRLQPWAPDGWALKARLHHQVRDMPAYSSTLLHLRSFDPKAAQSLEREMTAVVPGGVA